MGAGVNKRAVVNGAALYIRVSTQEQATEGVSLEAQEERLRAYCAMRGLEVVAVIREEGVSGGKPLCTRPGGADLLSLAATGKAAHIVALKLDRLFRDAEDALHETKAWDKAGVALHLVDMGGQTVDTSSAMGRMILTMLAGFAEFERGVIRERTTTALRYKKAHGQVYGPTPYGFERQGAALVEASEEQAVLVGIGECHQAGHSLRSIARDLTARNVPTKRGGVWKAATVRRLLQNNLQLAGAL
jgi:site-specific DNA recombinase